MDKLRRKANRARDKRGERGGGIILCWDVEEW